MAHKLTDAESIVFMGWWIRALQHIDAKYQIQQRGLCPCPNAAALAAAARVMSYLLDAGNHDAALYSTTVGIPADSPQATWAMIAKPMAEILLAYEMIERICTMDDLDLGYDYALYCWEAHGIEPPWA